jgi:protease-4
MRKLSIIIVALLFVGWIFHRANEIHKRRRGVLAVVHLYGPIRTSLSSTGWGSPDAGDIAGRLCRLCEDGDVKAILLRINSPGGTIGGVQEIYREILRCKEKGKKVVASLGDVAASGGYYVASAADRVVAEPGTITGSIGVLLQFGNLQGLFQKVGLKLETIKSGAYKDMGSPGRALNPEERRLLQASINDAYQQFVEVVQTGRRLAPGKVGAVSDGRIFTGRQALQEGLVDELGNQEDARQVAIRLAHLPARPMLITDETRSFSSFLREMSTRWASSPWQDAAETFLNPRVEYLWR